MKRPSSISSRKNGGDGNKVINLVKSIERKAEDESDDPYLIAMAERARAVQESFENRQTSTAEALAALLEEVEANEVRKKQQAEKGFDGLTWFVYRTLLDAKIDKAEDVSRRIKGGLYRIPRLEAKRERPARAAQASDLRHLRGT